MKKKIVAIIPARAGSKELINKNIIHLNSKPLIYYTIKAAKLSKHVDKIIVSTDSIKIKEIAEKYGAEVPFIRPDSLSGDSATSEEVLTHAVKYLEKEEKYFPDIVVYLQITDVFRTKNMIDDCILPLLNDVSIDSAFMGLPVHKNFWRKKGKYFERIAQDIPYGIPRQKREPLYREDTGLALATRAKVIKSGRRIGDKSLVIPYTQSVDFIDIHNEFDLWLSETIIEKKKIIPNC
tara:strand:+ start:196 stop:903 length:708 start_codon:yes stop_codon:yes gene_type:complete